MAPATLPTSDVRVAKPAPKEADPIYGTPEHRVWRDKVVTRAGARCEFIENGQRCTRAEPSFRMYADHIKELKDGGAAFDPLNGQCLCATHHTLKTVYERSKRLRA